MTVASTSTIFGELDDYSLPVASIIGEHDFSISEDDYKTYREFFPEWADWVEANHELSGFIGEHGGEMSFYFPTYSLVCVPMTLLLHAFRISGIYAFSLTNLLVLVLALVVMYRCLRISVKGRLALLLLLSLNPVIYYIAWTSSEVLVYSLLVITLTCWYNRWYHRAAFFLSVAGTMNPVIMSFGIIMIAEYLIKLVRTKKRKQTWPCFIKRNVGRVLGYGACYLIGIVPFVYDYIFAGQINVTMGDMPGQSLIDVLRRFVAYIIDLNFGLLPYYPLVLLLCVVFLVDAVRKRAWWFIELVASFVVLALLYSIMPHFNSGMSGIARYNAWAVTFLIIGVCVYIDSIKLAKPFRFTANVMQLVGGAMTLAIVCGYGLPLPRDYVYMMPIAEYVLDHNPQAYNPLPSTFVSRTLHVDGGYDEYETPVFYMSGENDAIRKILASDKDRDVLLAEYKSTNDACNTWFEAQVAALGERESYISIPTEYDFGRWGVYEQMGVPISFGENGDVAERCFVRGASYAEGTSRWTDGKRFRFRVQVHGGSERIRGHIELEDVFSYAGAQRVTIAVNGEEVYSGALDSPQPIDFTFENPKNHLVEMVVDLPDAISPSEAGLSGDGRQLALKIRDMTFFDASAAADEGA